MKTPCYKLVAVIMVCVLCIAHNSIAQDFNITRPTIHVSEGLSVNTYSGNLFYEKQLLLIPDQGLDLEVTLSYNSGRRETNNGLGNGWSFNYQMRLITDSLGIYVEKGDGRRDLYTLTNGEYNAPTGVFSHFEEYQPNKFRLTGKHGIKYFFDDADHSKVTKIEDRNGNQITFAYADSLLTSIASPTGRILNLSWSNGYISQIASNTTPARTVLFEHDGNGNLTKLIKTDSATVDYKYDDQHQLIKLTDENGAPISIVYNERRAISQIVTCTTSKRFTYDYNNFKTFVTERVSDSPQVTIYDYNELGQLVVQSGNCCGYNMKFEYDQNNNIKKRIDANGNVTLFVYDTLGNVKTETDALGHSKHWEYNVQYSFVSSETDRNGNTTTYTYDSDGNLLTVNKPLNITLSYTYDSFGNQLTITNGNDNVTQYTYDSHGNAESMTAPMGGVTTFTYDGVGNILTTTDPNGNLTTFTYDAADRFLTTTDAIGNSMTYQYDMKGNMTTKADWKNHVTQYIYDASDRMIERIDPLGNSSLIQYDEAGNPLLKIDENGNSTAYAYNNLNRMVSMTSSIGEQTQCDYDPNGNMVSVSLPSGNIIVTSFDVLNRPVGVTDEIGQLATMIYDNNSNVLSQADGEGNQMTYQYDALNRRVAEIDPFGKAVVTTFDNNDNIISTQDRKNQVTSYEYDANDRQISITDALNYVTVFDYDDADNLISVTDANMNITSFEYDSLNRVEKEILPDLTFTMYSFDANGNISSRLDNNGDVTTYTYDPLDRLLSRSYQDSTQTSFTYDPVGKLIIAINENATVEFDYDDVYRITSEALNGVTTGYLYQTEDRTRKIIYPGSKQILEKYDPRGRISEIWNPLAPLDPLVTYSYDLANRMIQRNYDNGTYTFHTYDQSSRVSNITHGPMAFAKFGYGYDDEDNRIYESRYHAIVRSEQYQYDALHRLTQYKRGQLNGNQIQMPDFQSSFNMDALGNRNTVNFTGGSDSYITNDLNQYTSVSGSLNFSLTYDNNGNLINDGIRSYQYDYENRLISIDSGSIATYLYDPLGRRICKMTQSDTLFFYYNGIRVIEERNEMDFTLATYVYGNWIDEILIMDRIGVRSYYHHDGIECVTHLTNENGYVIERYEYTPYGRPIVINAQGEILSVSAFENPFLFTSQRYDFESELLFYKTRCYIPDLGRFLQRDPLGFVDGYSMYEYVRSSPKNWIDPMGLASSPHSLTDRFRLNPRDVIKAIGEHLNGILEKVQQFNRRDWIKATEEHLNGILGIVNISGASNFCTRLGFYGTAIEAVVTLDEFRNDLDVNTYIKGGKLIVKGAAAVVVITGGVTAAPTAATVLTLISIYEVGDYIFHFGDSINRHIGKDSGLW